jgi:hypothetical protein
MYLVDTSSLLGNVPEPPSLTGLDQILLGDVSANHEKTICVLTPGLCAIVGRQDQVERGFC